MSDVNYGITNEMKMKCGHWRKLIPQKKKKKFDLKNGLEKSKMVKYMIKASRWSERLDTAEIY